MKAICTYRQTSSLYFIASNFTWLLQAITAVTKIQGKKTASFEACYCFRAAAWLETCNKANLFMQITHWLRHYNCKILWLGESQGVTVTSAIHWHRLPSIIPTAIIHAPLSSLLWHWKVLLQVLLYYGSHTVSNAIVKLQIWPPLHVHKNALNSKLH